MAKFSRRPHLLFNASSAKALSTIYVRRSFLTAHLTCPAQHSFSPENKNFFILERFIPQSHTLILQPLTPSTKCQASVEAIARNARPEAMILLPRSGRRHLAKTPRTLRATSRTYRSLPIKPHLQRTSQTTNKSRHQSPGQRRVLRRRHHL